MKEGRFYGLAFSSLQKFNDLRIEIQQACTLEIREQLLTGKSYCGMGGYGAGRVQKGFLVFLSVQ